MTASSTREQCVSLTATATQQERNIAPTACSDVVEHGSAPTLPLLYPSKAPAYGAVGGSQNDAIFILTDSESASMSESEDETDDNVPSPKIINDRIDKETMSQHIGTIVSTIRNVPSTLLALPLGSEADEQVIASAQRSPSPTSPTISLRQRPRDEIDSSRRSSDTSITEKGDHHCAQTDGASELRLSQCDNYEPCGPAELPRQTRPHGSASRNDSACFDGIGKTTDDDDRHSYSDSSSDNDGGNDGDDDEYIDDGSCSDSDGEDDDYSKNSTMDCSPSASRPPPDHKMEETTAATRKRRKVAHDKAYMILPHLNTALHSAGRLSPSPERPLTAGMPSPPTSHGLSVTESDAGSDCSKASEASFQEWPLPNTALKCVTIDGVTTYQVQFEWPICAKHSREVVMSHKNRRQRASGFTGSRANRFGPVPRARVNFLPEEEELLRRLKESGRGYSWRQIHKLFNETYPGRSQAALQVRYSTKLKSRDEGTS